MPGKKHQHSVSAAQQAVMGQAWALRSGQLKIGEIDPRYRKEIQNIAKGDLSDIELKTFASTKSSKLPNYVQDGKSFKTKPVEESQNNSEVNERGIAVPGATSPIVSSSDSIPSYTPGLSPGGGIASITPRLNFDVKEPKKGRKLQNLADYREFINRKSS